jgi:hypothetical protein
LEAFHNRSENNPSPIVHGVRQKRPSTQKWEISLKAARDALGLAREANLMAQRLQEETSERDDSNKRPISEDREVTDSWETADHMAEEALLKLEDRYDSSLSTDGSLAEISVSVDNAPQLLESAPFNEGGNDWEKVLRKVERC